MQSLIVLSIVFSLLAAYLEAMSQPQQASIQPLLTAKVIRTAPSSHTTKQINNDREHKLASAKANPTSLSAPLNLKLQLPLLKDIELQYNESKSSMLNLFQQRHKEAITYNAELVFDAEKGENITGGKVNIKIPFG